MLLKQTFLVFLIVILSGCAHSNYAPGEYFDKPGFNYETYAREARACGREANSNISGQGLPVVVGGAGGLAMAIAFGFLEGMAEQNQKREFLVQCLQNKGYKIGEVGEKERKRRIAYLKKYAQKERKRSKNSKVVKRFEPIKKQESSSQSFETKKVTQPIHAQEQNNKQSVEVVEAEPQLETISLEEMQSRLKANSIKKPIESSKSRKRIQYIQPEPTWKSKLE